MSLQVKSVSNVIRVKPYFKQSSFNTQFVLIHALNLSPECVRDDEKFVYLLIASNLLNEFKHFDDRLLGDMNFALNIYPPW